MNIWTIFHFPGKYHFVKFANPKIFLSYSSQNAFQSINSCISYKSYSHYPYVFFPSSKYKPNRFSFSSTCDDHKSSEISIFEKNNVKHTKNVISQVEDTIDKQLQILEQNGLQQKLSSFAIKRKPVILGTPLDQMIDVLIFLKEIGVKQPGNVIRYAPWIFEISIKILKKKAYYLKSLGIANIGMIVDKNPDVLRYHIEDLKKRVSYLREKGVVNLDILVTLFPTVLTTPTNKLNEAIRFIIEKIGVDDVDLPLSEEKYHFILVQSDILEQLKKTLNYLVKICKYKNCDIKCSPLSIGASLEDVIKPRYEFILENKLILPCLETLALSTSEKFCMEYDIEK